MISNNDLLAIHKGINFVVLESKWEKNMAEGERTLTVRFSRPVLKTKMTRHHAAVVMEWAKVHPRHWLVEVTGHYANGATVYDETVELEATCKLNDLTEAYKSALSDVYASGNPRHLLGASWRATIKRKALSNKA